MLFLWIFRDKIDFSRGIRIPYHVREQASPSTSRGITTRHFRRRFAGRSPHPLYHHSFFSNRFIIEAVMIYRHDSDKRLSPQNLAKFALCRKILRKQGNYTPRRFKRHVGAKLADCERGLTDGFPIKNWCSFDAMTVRKRTDLSLLSGLLSPISEPWNDIFQSNKSP